MSQKMAGIGVAAVMVVGLATAAQAGIATGAVKEFIGTDALSGDFLGQSVAMDGDVVVVGAPLLDLGTTNAAGAVYVFQRNQGGANAWAQRRKLTSSSPATGDQLGWSVAVAGDILAAGARFGDVGIRTNTGFVLLFQRNAGGTNNWGEVALLAPAAVTNGDAFGIDVAVDGDVLVAGAPFHDIGGTNSAGAVFVFERRNSGTTSAWVEVAQLVSTEVAPVEFFGSSVEVYGDVIAVGAPGDNGGVGGKGAVYLFERNATSNRLWGGVAKLRPADLPVGANFGQSVALRNGSLLVGAPGASTSLLSNAGSVYTFARTRSGTNAWQQLAKLEPSDASPGQDFGRSVALVGDLAFVGAPLSNFVYAFQRDAGGEEAWGEVARIAAPAPGGSILDSFGAAVAVRPGALLIGSSGAGPADTGAAYLYPGIHEEWIRYGIRSQNNRVAGDEFGSSVDVDGSLLIVGAPFRDLDGTNDVGAAYIFERGTSDQVRRLLGTSSEDDHFGRSVAVDGDVAVVGAPLDDLYAPNCGRAYVFHRNEGGSNNWGRILTVPALLSLTTPTTNDNFGSAVAISGDTIIVGRPGRNDNRGMVDFFVRNQDGTNEWGFVSSYLGSVQLPNRNFGSSLAIDGDTAIIGAPGDNFTNGAVYIVQRRAGSTNDWREVRRIPSPDAVLNDAFGRNVALSGDTALVNVYSLGKAYVFERDRGGTNTWGQAAVLIPTNAAGVTYGGINSVHIAGDIAVLGDPFATVDGTPTAGAAWVFERNAGGSNAWGQVAVVRQVTPASLDRFGFDVAVDGQTLLVGVPEDDPNGVTNAGRAVVFTGVLYGAPRIEAMTQTGNVFRLTFPTQPAWSYKVEAALDFVNGPWLAIPGLTGLPGETDGSTTVAHTNIFNGSAYRILRGEP